MHSIDLHAHILPGVDDGPADLAGSHRLARAAVAAGTREIVATPHVNERYFIAPLEIPGAVARLNASLEAEGIGLEVHAGAEIALSRLLDLTEEELDALRLGSGPYLLLESPLGQYAADFEPLLHTVLAGGHSVLLAHPERCPAFRRDPSRLEALVEAGMLVQVTAGAMVGDFGERVRGFALQLLRDDLVHVVASDCHDHVRRPPGVVAAVMEADRHVPGLADRARCLTEDAPRAILDGEPLPEPPPLPVARRSAWRRLRAVSSGR